MEDLLGVHLLVNARCANVTLVAEQLILRQRLVVSNRQEK
jgi:hypothetical protein